MVQHPLDDDSRDHWESELDVTSEPELSSQDAPELSQAARAKRRPVGQQVRFYFGCCRVTFLLNPPTHVMIGESDIWRVHCPRCGRLTEVLVK